LPTTLEETGSIRAEAVEKLIEDDVGQIDDPETEESAKRED